MKCRVLLSLIFAAVLPGAASAAEVPVQLADASRAVDLARYAGTWYEIARQPHFFQRNCASDVTATYTAQADHVRVVNACRKEDGELMSIEGKAFVTDAPINRKLEVGFFEIFGWMPIKGEYWVLDFDPEYRWAIVGGENREYGWILSREPQLDVVTRADIDARLRTLGYDPAAFLTTLQSK